MALVLRKYVRADLDASDRFLDPSPYGLRFSTPSQFLHDSAAFRWMDIAWRSALLLISLGLSGFFVSLVVQALPAAHQPLRLLLLVVPLVCTLGIAVASQAYLRWMLRERRRARGSRVSSR